MKQNLKEIQCAFALGMQDLGFSSGYFGHFAIGRAPNHHTKRGRDPVDAHTHGHTRTLHAHFNSHASFTCMVNKARTLQWVTHPLSHQKTHKHFKPM